MLTPIIKAYVAPYGDGLAVFAKAKDGRKLRHLNVYWDDEKHPHEIARVITIRGRIHEDYWVEMARVSRTKVAA